MRAGCRRLRPAVPASILCCEGRPWLNDTDITKYYLTLQHASGHKLGRNFFFVDLINSTKNDPSGGSYGEIYSEGYSTWSLSKITGAKVQAGPVRDVSLTLGYNFGAKSNGANPRVFLFGPTVDFAVPGFIFFNVDFLAYDDKSRFAGAATRGACDSGHGVSASTDCRRPEPAPIIGA